MIKVFSDGSNTADASRTKSAIVIYDNNEIIETYSQIDQIGWSDVAEYRAVLQGLKRLIALNLNCEQIYWFNDSQFVMNQMSGDWKVHSNRAYTLIARECLELKKQFSDIEFNWIPREQNEVADALSKF